MRKHALHCSPTSLPAPRWLACVTIVGLALSACSNRDDASDGPDIVSGADSAENDTAGSLEDGGAEDAGPSTDSSDSDATAEDSATPDGTEPDGAADDDASNADAANDDASTIPDTPCASDKDCAALDAVCDVDAGQCVACNVDADCTDDATPVCKGHVCVPPPTTCETSKQCFDAGKVCDTAAGFCVDCLSDVDCEATSYCAVAATSSLENACLPDICADGETRCHPESGTHQTCNAAGSDFDDTPCAADTQLCKDGACADIVCTPNAVSCFASDGLPDAVITCSADGTEEAETLCNSDEACVEDGQGGASCEKTTCSPGTTSCDDAANAVLVCNNNGVGSSPVPCSGGTVCAVDDADGKASCKPTVCTPGGHFCDGTKKLLCDAKGLSGSEVVDCAAGGGICLNGECASNLCSQGSTQCDGDDKLATCNDPAKGWEVTPCPSGQACAAGACKAKVCEKGSTQCKDANTVETCDEPTVGYSGATPCGNDQLCAAGVCVVAKCVVGTSQCKDATTLETCKDATVGFEAEACPSGQGCDDASGSCKVQTCTPGTSSCAGDKVMTCDAAGLSEVVSDDCGAKQETCDAATASCQAVPACVAWDLPISGVSYGGYRLAVSAAGTTAVAHPVKLAGNNAIEVSVVDALSQSIAADTFQAGPALNTFLSGIKRAANSGFVLFGSYLSAGGSIANKAPYVRFMDASGSELWVWLGAETFDASPADVAVVGNEVLVLVEGPGWSKIYRLDLVKGQQIGALDLAWAPQSRARSMIPFGNDQIDLPGYQKSVDDMKGWHARLTLSTGVFTETLGAVGQHGGPRVVANQTGVAMSTMFGGRWRRATNGVSSFEQLDQSKYGVPECEHAVYSQVALADNTFGVICVDLNGQGKGASQDRAYWVTMNEQADVVSVDNVFAKAGVPFKRLGVLVDAFDDGGIAFATELADGSINLRRVPSMLQWSCP